MFSLLSSFFKTRRVRCPDGTERIIHRDIDHAFPIMITGWEGNIAGDLKTDVAGDARIDAKYKTKIEGLLIALDESNNNIMLEFRAAYVAFQSDQCGNGDYLPRSIDRISGMRAHLIQMRMRISALIEIARNTEAAASHSEFMAIFSEVIGILPPKSAVPITIAEIKDAQSVASDFIEARR